MVGLLVCISSISAFAMHTGFETEELSAEEKTNFLENTHLSRFAEEPEKEAVECFDVSEDGLLAIGISDSTTSAQILVYTLDGQFLYGYTFDCRQDFGIEWDEDNNLLIYFVRSDIAALYNQEGINLELKRIKNTETNNTYWHESVLANQKTVGNKNYILKNDMGILNLFATANSQIVEEDGEKQVLLYDVSHKYKIQTAVVTSLICLFAAAIVIPIVWNLVKQIKKTNQVTGAQ